MNNKYNLLIKSSVLALFLFSCNLCENKVNKKTKIYDYIITIMKYSEPKMKIAIIQKIFAF